MKIVAKSKIYENTSSIYWNSGIFDYLLPKIKDFVNDIDLDDLSSFLEFCASSQDFNSTHYEYLIFLSQKCCTKEIDVEIMSPVVEILYQIYKLDDNNYFIHLRQTNFLKVVISDIIPVLML